MGDWYSAIFLSRSGVATAWNSALTQNNSYAVCISPLEIVDEAAGSMMWLVEDMDVDHGRADNVVAKMPPDGRADGLIRFEGDALGRSAEPFDGRCVSRATPYAECL